MATVGCSKRYRLGCPVGSDGLHDRSDLRSPLTGRRATRAPCCGGFSDQRSLGQSRREDASVIAEACDAIRCQAEPVRSLKGIVVRDYNTIEADVRGWYDAYFTTFVKLAVGERSDVDSLLDFYGVPMVVITENGCRALSNREEVLSFAKSALDDLIRMNYAGTTIERLDIRPLDPYAAFVEGVFSRRDSQGKEFDQAGSAYLVARTNRGWRVASFVPRTALTVLV
jgi:hypothetical protein